MKRLILLLCIVIYSTQRGLCPPDTTLIIEFKPPVKPFEALSHAVAIVESKNNPNAYNKKENAVGRYQIRQIRIDDFNQKTGKSYQIKEMYDTIKAKEVFMWYAMEIGYQNPEKIIRCWNGGDRRMKKQSTVKYYKKVLKYLDNSK